MSVDNKELKRVINLQVGKLCQHCKTGKYVKFGILLCDNCGKEPLKNMNYI